jgi:hypothetical protein
MLIQWKPFHRVTAYTNYKAQGQSLAKVLVDLSTCRSLQSVYVMLSQAGSLQNIVIVRWFPPKKKTNVCKKNFVLNLNASISSMKPQKLDSKTAMILLVFSTSCMRYNRAKHERDDKNHYPDNYMFPTIPERTMSNSITLRWPMVDPMTSIFCKTSILLHQLPGLSY